MSICASTWLIVKSYIQGCLFLCVFTLTILKLFNYRHPLNTPKYRNTQTPTGPYRVRSRSTFTYFIARKSICYSLWKCKGQVTWSVIVDVSWLLINLQFKTGAKNLTELNSLFKQSWQHYNTDNKGNRDEKHWKTSTESIFNFLFFDVIIINWSLLNNIFASIYTIS